MLNFKKVGKIFAIFSQPKKQTWVKSCLPLIIWLTLSKLLNLCKFPCPYIYYITFIWFRSNICKTQQVLLKASIIAIFLAFKLLNKIESPQND